jgi:hypothetical protein
MRLSLYKDRREAIENKLKTTNKAILERAGKDKDTLGKNKSILPPHFRKYTKAHIHTECSVLRINKGMYVNCIFFCTYIDISSSVKYNKEQTICCVYKIHRTIRTVYSFRQPAFIQYIYSIHKVSEHINLQPVHGNQFTADKIQFKSLVPNVKRIFPRKLENVIRFRKTYKNIKHLLYFNTVIKSIKFTKLHNV